MNAADIASQHTDSEIGARLSAVDVLGAHARWGWLPLVGGCVVLAALSLAIWELALSAAGAPSFGNHPLLVLQTATTAGLLAGFTGWYVLRSRRRIEAAREELRKREEAVAERIRRAEQAAGVAAVSRLVAHELRTPLHNIALGCELALRNAKDAASSSPHRLRDALSVLDGEVRRMDKLLTEYLASTRQLASTLSIDQVRLDSVVREAIAALEPAREARGVAVSIESGGQKHEIVADAEKVRQLVRHVVRNALEATGKDGHVRVSLENRGRIERLVVADDGPGFPDPEAALRPFHSTKAAKLGVGLAIARDIVRAHRGEMRVRNLQPRGAAVEIDLPVEAAA